MSSKLTKVISNFETQLLAKISAGGTTGNILSNLDSDGVAIPNGKYCMYVDGDNSQAEHLVFDLSGTAMSNIKSVSRQGVQTTGAVREHRIGAQVVITDFVNLKTLVDILNGSEPLDSTNPLYYDADAVFDDDNQLINKKYADSLTVAGLTSLFAYKESGLNLHVNSGYYDRNGVNTFYAGATGVAMTDDATNYVELIDGVLSVNQTSFTDYSTAIAIVIASSGEITTVTDARAFSNTFDAKALGGIDKDSAGFFVKLESTNPTLQVDGSNQLGAKLKSGGGILNGADGMYVDVGTTDGKIVQMTTGDKLPAVDGSQLTGTGTDRLVGTGNIIDKPYINFTIPFIVASVGSNSPTALWTITGHNTSNYYLSNSTFRAYPNADSTNTIITTNSNSIACFDSDPISFSSGKKIIVEFSLKTNNYTTEQMGWGLSQTTAPFIDFDDASVTSACFTVGTDGRLYAHTANSGGGVNHTEVEITGITLTNMNTYRIEFNPGVNVLFYVNNILRQTITTNIPTYNYVNFGAGSSGNGAYPYIITSPNFSIEK